MESHYTANFKLEAERIRIACAAERLDAEARVGRPGAPLLVADKPLPEAPVQRYPYNASWSVDGNEFNEHNVTADGWQLLSIAID